MNELNAALGMALGAIVAALRAAESSDEDIRRMVDQALTVNAAVRATLATMKT